jgi:uncharacterized RDD family membrane protein YckC
VWPLSAETTPGTLPALPGVRAGFRKGWRFLAVVASPGKRIPGWSVYRSEGSRVGTGLRLTRSFLARVLPGLIGCIGFSLTALRKDESALHDVIAMAAASA